MNTKAILIGLNDRKVLQEGWYGLEKSPDGLLYRASSVRAEWKIAGFGGRIRLTLLLAARPEHVGKPLQATVSTETGTKFEFQLGTNQWTTRNGELILPADGKIALEVYTPWSPHQLYQNGDARSLGILLSALHIRTA
ncbi:MAG: hypothetical protein AB1656_22265 [Candidatus Omnitrophota bacterium]